MSWADIQARLAGYQNAKEMQAAQAQENQDAGLSGFDLTGMNNQNQYNPYGVYGGGANYYTPTSGLSGGGGGGGPMIFNPQSGQYDIAYNQGGGGLDTSLAGQGGTGVDVTTGGFTGATAPQSQYDTSQNAQNLYADYY
jgi:hypothetical protein